MYFEALSKKYGFKLTTPVEELPEEVMDVILYGTKGEKLKLTYDRENGKGTLMQAFEGVVNNLERRYRETQSDAMRRDLEECMAERPCPDCGGKRLRKEALAVTVGGISIDAFCRKSVNDARPHPQGDQEPPWLPPECGAPVPDPEPGCRHPVRRREPAHPPGHPDRFLPHGGALYSGRAVHRPAPAGQRHAAGHHEAPARPGQHPAGGRARRGHHAGGRLYRGHRPRRRRSRPKRS